jgi:signal transduction histidine kinase
MRHVTGLLNVRFEERLAERGRIAQDLHDNLLQGILSLSMQLRVLAEQLPADVPARISMNRILQLTDTVVHEGRKTLQGLRSSIENPDDLVNALAQIPQELGEPEVTFRIVVEGSSLPLRPAIRDDVYCIGREALMNAFRHSRARNIDLRLEYSANELGIYVRDNGRGIDPRMFTSGCVARRGLAEMQGRAGKIGAKLRVRAGPVAEQKWKFVCQVALPLNG